MNDAVAQRVQIYEYFLAGGALTSLDALHKFGCMRLGARVWELKKMGIPILDRWVGRVNANGKWKRYKEYYMEKTNDRND